MKIPLTALLSVTLVSADAHLSLQDPRGRVITPRDTSEALGVIAFSLPRFQGFQITNPQPGTWTVRIDAAASAPATQQYGCFIEFASPWAARLSATQVVEPGDSIHVRAEVTNGAVIRSDVRWGCTVLDPDRTKLGSLPLFNDGRHGDARANDGIFGGSMVAPGAGLYSLLGVATVPGVGELTAPATFEAVPYQDLFVTTRDIRFSNDRPVVDDSITIFATFHNRSAIPANGVEATIRAHAIGDERGFELGSASVNLPVGGSATVQVGWRAWRQDSARIQAEISPYAMDEENFANNVATRWIQIRPRPVEVPGERSGTKFDEPRLKPGTEDVVFSYRLARPSPVRLLVRETDGRRVLRQWRWAMRRAGPHLVVWDRRDSTGVRAPSDSYWCVLEVDGDRIPQLVHLGD